MAILPTTRPRARAGIGVDRLSGLRPGQAARVVAVDPSLPDAIRRRLADLGVEEGAEVTRVRDYDLCLRRREADCVRCDARTEA